MPNINERVEAVIRAWPQWSRAERRRMDDLVAEILDHCRNGTGNHFIREWCNRVLVPAMPGMVLDELDSVSYQFPGPDNQE